MRSSQQPPSPTAVPQPKRVASTWGGDVSCPTQYVQPSLVVLSPWESALKTSPRRRREAGRGNQRGIHDRKIKLECSGVCIKAIGRLFAK